MAKTNHITQAVERVRKHDRLAMKLLYDTYAKEMLSIAYRITNNLADAEDILQESFLASFNKIHQLKESQNYRYWLKRMVVNNSIKQTRGRVFFKEVEEDLLMVDYEEKNWYAGVGFDKINKAIQTLPNGCREVVCLYLLDGYKHREIAELYQVSVSTSKSQYRYGLKLLKEKLMTLKKYSHE